MFMQNSSTPHESPETQAQTVRPGRSPTEKTAEEIEVEQMEAAMEREPAWIRGVENFRNAVESVEEAASEAAQFAVEAAQAASNAGKKVVSVADEAGGFCSRAGGTFIKQLAELREDLGTGNTLGARILRNATWAVGSRPRTISPAQLFKRQQPWRETKVDIYDLQENAEFDVAHIGGAIRWRHKEGCSSDADTTSSSPRLAVFYSSKHGNDTEELRECVSMCRLMANVKDVFEVDLQAYQEAYPFMMANMYRPMHHYPLPTLPGFFFGPWSVLSSHSCNTLRISHVVSVTPTSLAPLVKTELTSCLSNHLHAPVTSEDSESLEDHLTSILQFMHHSSQTGGNVLVHSEGGSSIAVIVMVAYLIRYQGVSCEDAIETVKCDLEEASLNERSSKMLEMLEKQELEIKLSQSEEQIDDLNEFQKLVGRSLDLEWSCVPAKETTAVQFKVAQRMDSRERKREQLQRKVNDTARFLNAIHRQSVMSQPSSADTTSPEQEADIGNGEAVTFRLESTEDMGYVLLATNAKGDLVPDVLVSVFLKHTMVSNRVQMHVKTDPDGVVILGELANITEVTATWKSNGKHREVNLPVLKEPQDPEKSGNELKADSAERQDIDGCRLQEAESTKTQHDEEFERLDAPEHAQKNESEKLDAPKHVTVQNEESEKLGAAKREQEAALSRKAEMQRLAAELERKSALAAENKAAPAASPSCKLPSALRRLVLVPVEAADEDITSVALDLGCEITVGRSHSNIIRIRSKKVSGLQAVISRGQDGGVSVVNRGKSSNTSILKFPGMAESRVKPDALSAMWVGDVLVVGECMLQLAVMKPKDYDKFPILSELDTLNTTIEAGMQEMRHILKEAKEIKGKRSGNKHRGKKA